MKLTPEQARALLARAEVVHSEAAVAAAIERVAAAITERIAESCPLVLCVMTGGAVFSGQLLPKLPFLLDFDYLHVTRYDQQQAESEIGHRFLLGYLHDRYLDRGGGCQQPPPLVSNTA